MSYDIPTVENESSVLRYPSRSVIFQKTKIPGSQQYVLHLHVGNVFQL